MTTRREFLAYSAAALYDWARNPDVDFLTRRDTGFARHRRCFNTRIDRMPAAIALCRTEKGVIESVDYARRRGLPVTIKSGGHSFEGFCISDGGLVIELSALNALGYHEKARLFTAGPGATISQTYDFLLPRGRLIPLGSCGGVGLGGLTLGGGYGLFSRKYGLTCDSLRGVRMIDGLGRVQTTRGDKELLWACRGGGNGNFGIITGFVYRTVEAPQRLTQQRYKYFKLTPARAVERAREWFEFAAGLPRDAFSAFVLNGRTLTILVTSFESEIAPLKAVTPRTEPLARACRRYYGRKEPLFFKNASAGFYRGFGDIEKVAERVFAQTARGAIFQINTLGGAIGTGTGAFPHRAYPFLGEVQGYSERSVAVVRAIQDLLGGVSAHYRNYPDAGFKNWAESYYGAANYERLQRVKRRFDPHNLIRHPQSVRA